MREVVIIGAARTAIGNFGGALSTVPAVELGRVAAEAVLQRSGVDRELVDEAIIGNVLSAGLGQNVARQIVLAAGLRHEVGAMTLNHVCGSGFPLATAIFVPLIAMMFNELGMEASTEIWAGIFVVGAALAWIVIRDNPEEVGCCPDNDPAEDRASIESLEQYRSSFTVGRLLKDRDMWLIALGWGSLWLVTVGIVVQLVPRLVSVGYSQPRAIAFLSAAAVCAVPGGVLWGWLDHKFGPKKASMLYGAIYVVTLVLLITQTASPTMTFLTIVLVGIGLGGIKNLITSMVSTVYGRFDFTSAYRLVIPISIVVRTLCFPIMGVAMQRFHSLAAAYLAFIVVDVVALLLVAATRGTCKGRIALGGAATPP